MLFSQRKGFKPVRSAVQKESMDQNTYNSLWNALHIYFWKKVSFDYRQSDVLAHSNLDILFQRYWHYYFKLPLDQLPTFFSSCLQRIRGHFFSCRWNEVYDFIEFTIQNAPDDLVPKFTDFCNHVLETEMSAYRIVNRQIVEITSEEEISSIEQAIQASKPFPGAQTHLQTALALLSDRKNPDFRNSIKESISAVEALSKALSGKPDAALGDALKVLGEDIHGAFKTALSKLYGWTSDDQGIRHSLMEESKLGYSDAKFMLVSCTAFINYLTAKTSEKSK